MPGRVSITLTCLVFAGCSLQRSGLQPVDAVDASPLDADVGDGGADGGRPDTGRPDTGRPDTGPPPDGCVASAETCDARDEDCDGLVDEGVSRPCSTACGAGVEACVDGSFGACDAPPVGAETCNGADDDCDGVTDEALTQACSTACGSGMETCSGGVFAGCTAPPVGAETCNGMDDDCDGMTDEALTRACSTACGSGMETCTAGVFAGCTAPPVGTETCNGVDDDCDGMTDEALTRMCSSACGSGVETCTAGSFGGCTAPTPGTETCNAMDDDCDGRVDEGMDLCGCIRGIRGTSTYLLCDRQVTWTDARDYCTTRGYSLATFETDAEALAAANTALMIADADWWIGLNDRAVEDTFVWQSGSTATFRRWSGGQPNDFGGQDCVTIDNGGAFEDRTRWGDKDCGETNRFICETP